MVRRVPAAPRERLITRYENRKLYEPAARRYVTLAEIRTMVAEGDEVHVHDRKSGEDLTAQILAQILLDQLKDRTASIPRQVLVGLVRLSAGQSGWGEWPHPQHLAERVRGEAERIATGLLARGRLTLDEAASLRHEIAHALQAALGERGGAGGVGPALRTLQTKLETLQSDLAPPPRRRAPKPRRRTPGRRET